MKVWIDISNAPQVHFFKNVIRRLEREGHEVVVSARSFGAIEPLLSNAGIPYTLVGQHGGAEREGKLMAYSERVSELTRFVSKNDPDIALFKHSVEAPRVAYGLDMPSLCVLDNEHAIAQNKLMLPISQRVIAPEAISIEDIMSFGVEEDQIRHFKGFCELAHIHDFLPSVDVLNEFELSEDDPIAVLRPEPVMANYYHGDPSQSIVSSLLPVLDGFNCIVFPRTPQQAEMFSKLGAIVPSRCIDALSLINFSDLVISAGGSMNREAVALLKPAISTYPEKLLSITSYMVENGIKSHSCDPAEIKSHVDDLVNNAGYLNRLRRVLRAMENPIDVIVEELEAVALPRQ